ncbi:MAG: GIY-YIG nuclease family protein [Spirulina sp. SIO3F2]|nr:GIY-YIG nuclease family protein [Spirulina sp. SIO3F2]
MIDPKSITPASLPSVPLGDRQDLPAIAGIYFALDSQGKVQYIGRSVNLQQRWTLHHRTNQLEEMGGIRIAYLVVDDLGLLNSVEEALIEWFDPPLNGASVIGKKLKSKRLLTNLPDRTHELLRAWADKDGMSLSAMAAHIIKVATDSEEREGRLRLDDQQEENNP